MHFELQHVELSSQARAGLITPPRGMSHTLIFMPVGTVCTVKSVSQKALYGHIEAAISLGNTYHLYLRPGLEVLEAAGGLHQFMGENKPILTDSSGYQVYALAQRRILRVIMEKI